MKIRLFLLAFALHVVFTLPNLAQETRHCVVQVYPFEQNRDGVLLDCFNSAREALSFISNGEFTVPINASKERISSTIRNFQSGSSHEGTLANHVISIQWDWTDRGGTSVYFTSTSLCSQTYNGHLLSTNYSVSHPSWNNKVASAEVFGGCTSVQLWDLANFQGSSITCSTYCSNLGAMNDYTSSSRTWK